MKEINSSNHVIIYEIDDCPELRNYIKKEYGRFGKKLLEKHLIKDYVSAKKMYLFDYVDKNCYEDSKTYLKVHFFEWLTNNISEINDVLLALFIPDKYKKVVCKERVF